MNEIKLFLLSTGQEIIGEVVSTGGGDYHELINILQVGFMPPQRPGDQPSVGMGPWIPYRDVAEPVVFFSEHIIAVMKPNQDLLMNYQKGFSKVITPSSLIIPGK